ncbi:MAG: single-stranded-DNA-specific exonuclease RecJ [Atopobiaceae bacterium]|jgi:single-stranded-DNA-specific exonuclease
MSGLATSPRWNVLPQDEAAAERLVHELGVSRLVARVMVARGIKDVSAARAFLSPSLEQEWCDPLLIPGMEAAVERTLRALKAHETIAVFGDFDVDGMSATCLLTLGLRHFGGTVYPYIPHRFGEGYGLSKEALDRVLEGSKPDLIITVDNGIAAAHEVQWLVEQGVDVVVTDHHEPGDLVPKGVAVADPKLTDDCPSRELAGAGVALKMVSEIGARLGEPTYWRNLTELATLGTVSDMMLLEGENRALVKDGIECLRHTSRPGLVALAAIARADLASITADTLPFTLIPRLNAAGRMGTTDVAFDLLITDDPAEAALLAGELEKINNERREIESDLTDQALAVLDATYTGGRVAVVGGEGWHEGVKGIVASRIVNRLRVPAILFTISDGIARGSGRSVGSVDLFHAVEQCSDLLLRFGGHAGAVGVTLEAANLDAFRNRLEDVLDQLPAEQFMDVDEVAAEVSLKDLTLESVLSLEVLQPFGQGNKRPYLAVKGVTMKSRSKVGYASNHLCFTASDGISSVPAIMFRAPKIEDAYAYDGAVDLVFDAECEVWQGRSKVKLMVKDIIYRLPDADEADDTHAGAEPTLADELISRADEVLSRDEFAGIAEATSFFTKAVGVSFDGRQAVVSQLVAGDVLRLVHEKNNVHDASAVALMSARGVRVGYVRRQIGAALSPLIDAGVVYEAHVREVTGGRDGRAFGVNMQVMRKEPARDPNYDAGACLARRQELEALDEAALTDRLRTQFIGDHDFLPAQARALTQLEQGISTLCVMATGRGKSLIFHVHAAREALLKHRSSIFVYPLRALVNDQAFHLREELGPLGVRVRVLTGETSSDERDEVFGGLAAGETDIILTTPEFLTIHAKRFSAGQVGFVVIDEAHHAGASNRSAYNEMPEALSRLNNPCVLAVSATASTPVATTICHLFHIQRDAVVIDQSVRSNLLLEDHRELRDRELALISLVATGQKTIVYVNSREQSVTLARTLRHAIPDLAAYIGFYNAGLTRKDRKRVEEAFRSGELCCIISTSAFGEGVNLPDIRNVVLYHMPMGTVEFNQMSGRAGRDGKDARVWLMFGSRDARINERLLSSSAPSREELVTLYRTLMTLARQRGMCEEGEDEQLICMTNADIAQAALEIDPMSRLDERSVSCGVSIFRELGLLATRGYGSSRRIQMSERPERVELGGSIRYLEGERARNDFSEFSAWALSSLPQEILCRINRPITPSFGTVVDR